jgi:hypothetical protein
MTTLATPRGRRAGVVLVLVASLSACSGVSSGTATPSAAMPGPAAGPSAADAFAGLPFRLDLPAGWITQGSADYDTRLDSTPEVRAWLAGLGLDGQYAFRAYEPREDGAGLRVAVSPQRTWNPSPLQDEGSVAALPGVTGKVGSDVVATGADWKAFGYRWSETIDWGSGTPSARDCIGYFVMVDPNPVNVVLCYPTGTDRQAEAQAIASTFRMTGTPVFTPPPWSSPTPSPTEFDKNATPAPSTALHAVPELEALLPAALGGRPVAKESRTGADMGITEEAAKTFPLLAPFGKHPADLSLAQGTVLPGENQPAAIMGVERVRGVPGDQLQAAILRTMPDAKVSQVTLGGHQVTLVEYGAWPVWMYATGEDVYSIGLAGEAAAGEFFAALP